MRSVKQNFWPFECEICVKRIFNHPSVRSVANNFPSICYKTVTCWKVRVVMPLYPLGCEICGTKFCLFNVRFVKTNFLAIRMWFLWKAAFHLHVTKLWHVRKVKVVASQSFMFSLPMQMLSEAVWHKYHIKFSKMWCLWQIKICIIFQSTFKITSSHLFHPKSVQILFHSRVDVSSFGCLDQH